MFQSEKDAESTRHLFNLPYGFIRRVLSSSSRSSCIHRYHIQFERSPVLLCERCVNKAPIGCHPVRALRIYRCLKQNRLRQKKKRENKKKPQLSVNHQPAPLQKTFRISEGFLLPGSASSKEEAPACHFPKSAAVRAIPSATFTPKGQRLSQLRQPMHSPAWCCRER